jgi:hypothetical protein
MHLRRRHRAQLPRKGSIGVARKQQGAPAIVGLLGDAQLTAQAVSLRRSSAAMQCMSFWHSTHRLQATRPWSAGASASA